MRGKLGRVALGALLCIACGAAMADEALNEDKLIETIQSDAGWEAKYTACYGLRQVGTAESVPALATLLGDEKLSHMARYAMEGMPYPEVDKALRKALKDTSGKQKTGIIVSLGVRGDEDAVGTLAKELKSEDAEIVGAAAGSLGRIGSSKAVKELFKARKDAPVWLQDALGDGLMAAVEKAVNEEELKEATRICTTILESDWPMQVRMGAFRGAVLVEGENASVRLIEALGGDDDILRGEAAQLVAETLGTTGVEAYAAALPGLPPAGQVALLRGLGGAGDASARGAISAAIGSGNADVKNAAIAALGLAGTPEDVPTLVGLLGGADADAAKASLASMTVEGVDDAIAAAAAGATPAVQSQLIEALASRMSPQAVPTAMDHVGDSDAQVRIASLHALAQLGSDTEVPAVIAALKKSADANERSAAAQALDAICGVRKDDALPAVLEGMKDADTDSQVALVRTLGKIGSPKALEAVGAAIGSKTAAVSDEAVRVLAGWPTADAAPDLLDLAGSRNAARRDVALRGYVRLARQETDAAKKAEMLTAATRIAKSTEDKWLVLGAWGTLPSKQALDALTLHLDRKGVVNEASTAIVSVATEYAKQGDEAKAQSIEALKEVLKKCKDDAIKDRAQKALTALGA